MYLVAALLFCGAALANESEEPIPKALVGTMACQSSGDWAATYEFHAGGKVTVRSYDAYAMKEAQYPGTARFKDGKVLVTWSDEHTTQTDELIYNKKSGRAAPGCGDASLCGCAGWGDSGEEDPHRGRKRK
jgi:hypothetical protein